MKKILLIAASALALSGCLLDDDFWDDGYDSGYDCDCDDYFSQPAYVAPHSEPLRVTPRPN